MPRPEAMRDGNPTASYLRLQARALALQPQSRENFDREEAPLRQALVLDPGQAPTELRMANVLSIQAFNFDRGPQRSANR